MPRHFAVSIALLSLALAASGCSAVSARLVEWKKGQYRSDARLQEHRIQVAGHEIVYLDRGAGDPLVLVHGFGADKDNWTLFAKHIPDTYRVIALDLPGFGESSRDPNQSYDVRSQSARLLAFADALGLTRFDLAGNSMGGNISARFAIDHPERVKSLALFDSGGVISPHPSEFAVALAAGKNPLLVDSIDDFDRVLGMTFVVPPPLPGFIKHYFAGRAVTNRAFNDKVFHDLTQKPDRLESDLPRIQSPTLVLWGDTDRIIDVSAASVFQSAIPHARTVLMAQCGHAPMIERPDEAAAKYQEFLSSIAAR